MWDGDSPQVPFNMWQSTCVGSSYIFENFGVSTVSSSLLWHKTQPMTTMVFLSSPQILLLLGGYTEGTMLVGVNVALTSLYNTDTLRSPIRWLQLDKPCFSPMRVLILFYPFVLHCILSKYQPIAWIVHCAKRTKGWYKKRRAIRKTWPWQQNDKSFDNRKPMIICCNRRLTCWVRHHVNILQLMHDPTGPMKYSLTLRGPSLSDQSRLPTFNRTVLDTLIWS